MAHIYTTLSILISIHLRAEGVIARVICEIRGLCFYFAEVPARFFERAFAVRRRLIRSRFERGSIAGGAVRAARGFSLNW